MSITKLMRSVVKRTQLGPTEIYLFLVLLALADDELTCYTSLKELSELMQLSTESIKISMRELERKRLIGTVRYKDGRVLVVFTTAMADGWEDLV